MIAVLDTSAAVAAALQLEGSASPSRALAAAEQVLAPELFAAEVANVFWKYHHLQGMPLPDCQNGLDDALALPDELVPMSSLCREVFAMACHAGQPAHDLFFVVLARRYDALLVTLDSKLSALAQRLGIKTELPDRES